MFGNVNLGLIGVQLNNQYIYVLEVFKDYRI